MPNGSDSILEFQCPKCAKRLKAGSKIAGRKVKCPKCEAVVKVPGAVASKPIVEDLWLDLDSPAISDVTARKQEADSVKQAKELARRSKSPSAKAAPKLNASPTTGVKPRKVSPAAAPAGTGNSNPPAAPRRAAAADGPRPDPSLDTPLDDLQLEPLTSPSAARPAVVAANPPAATDTPRASIFDDDLPQLSEVEDRKPRDAAAALAAHLGTEDLEEVLAGQPAIASPREAEAEEDPNPEYRINCKTCGTPQYVRLKQKGDRLKCPDCFDVFTIPAPAAGAIKKKKRPMPVSTEPDMDLAPADASVVTDEQKHRNRANVILEKAKLELSDEEIDKLYDHDFDTSSFINRTFGCFRDPMCVAQIIGYGIMFGFLFAGMQFALSVESETLKKALLLAVGIMGPVIGLIFAMPMLSGGLALIESVANQQPKMGEWPGFNLFDNIGDVMVILVALVAAVLPGFLIGTFLTNALELGALVQITTVMMSTFALFPVFLLSMLDNGSLFQPISQSVIQSLREAAEAWGGYFLKTLVAFGFITIAWYMLLANGSPIGAGIAGFLLPLLVFFTCQQIGALADSIGEHLSFEFESEPASVDPASGREKISAI